jgi:hypothetical protein
MKIYHSKAIDWLNLNRFCLNETKAYQECIQSFYQYLKDWRSNSLEVLAIFSIRIAYNYRMFGYYDNAQNSIRIA